MKTPFLALVLILNISLLAGSACRSAPKAMILQREWTANAEFAGDVWASDLGEKHGIRLDVREGSEIIDPIKMVRAGTAQFGVASSDRVLRENNQGADLVVLAAACYRSPVVFLTKPALKIASPSDFKRRRIGIQAGTNTELVFKALIKTVPLSEKDMTVVEAGWGVTNFETGALDVMGAFDYDEPIQLDLKKVPYGIVEPEKFGVHFVGTVYFTSRSQIERNPKMVQAFVDSLVEGWEHALANPPAAIDLLASHFPSVDRKKELLSLQRGSTYFSGENGRLLYASQSRWEEMSKELISMGALTKFVFADNVDYRFLNSAEQTSK